MMDLREELKRYDERRIDKEKWGGGKGHRENSYY